MDVMSVDIFNMSASMGGVAKTLNSIATDSDHLPIVIILNDQGGSMMDISKDVTATLRAQDHGHPPVICLQGGGTTSSGHQNGNGWSDSGVANTVNTVDVHAVCYEISAGEAREGSTEVCQTLRSRMGTGGATCR